MYTALRASSLTLANMLRVHFIADPILRLFFDPGAGGTMDIYLNSPQEMMDNKLQGVSLWLYRVTKDGERANDPMMRLDSSRSKRRPLPLSLQYLITPIVPAKTNKDAASTGQVILGKVLQIFHDHPILNGADLKDDFTGTDLELGIHLESLSIDEFSRVFDALEQSFQLSLAYQVSLVMIDSGHEPLHTSPVQTVLPEYGLEVGA